MARNSLRGDIVRFAAVRSRWPDAALIFLLALLPCLFFWRLIAPNPADRLAIAGGDFTEQYFPLRAFAAQEWVQGRIPLWNPYLYGGQPALADIQSGALYPPHLVESLLLGWGGPLLGRPIGFPLGALELQVIVHFALAAVGAYLFMRATARRNGWSVRQARFAGVVASLVFTYSGYLTGFPVQQVTILEVSAWLPWVLWALSAALESTLHGGARPWRAVAAGAMAFAMAVLAGHPQTVLYVFYLTLAYAGFYLFLVWRARPGDSVYRLLLAVAGRWAAITLLGGAVAAAQLLPTLEFIGQSLRASLAYPDVAAGLPLHEFISLLYPGFLGGSPTYVGITSLVLVGLALLLGRPRSHVIFWAGMGLLSLLLAFGGSTFLYPLFYLLAPGFAAVRQQERVLLFYSFGAAVLAGYGAMALTRPLPRSDRLAYRHFERGLRRIAGLGLLLTVAFIYGSAASTARDKEVNLFFGVLQHHLFGLLILGGTLLWLAGRSRRWSNRPWAMGLLAAWLAFNLFTVNWRFNLAQPSAVPSFTPDGATQFLQAHLPALNGDQRFLAAGRVASGGLLPGGNSAGAVYRLEDLTGNTPLQLARMAAFSRAMPVWRLWQLMNVHYVVDSRDISNAGLKRVFDGGERQVFEVGDPFPRGWLVSRVEVVNQDEAAIARLAAADFDLRQTAVVPAPLPQPLTGASAATVSIDRVSPTGLTVTVEAQGAQLLVLSQVYYPGWQATIDGQQAKLLRVNVVLQGVWVPAGQHTVEVTYRPLSFWGGSLISALGLLLSCSLFLAGSLPARKRLTRPAGDAGQNALPAAERLADF